MHDPNFSSPTSEKCIIWKNISFCVKIKYIIMIKEILSDQKTINEFVCMQHVPSALKAFAYKSAHKQT
jgi:hypothetical protein